MELPPPWEKDLNIGVGNLGQRESSHNHIPNSTNVEDVEDEESSSVFFL